MVVVVVEMYGFAGLWFSVGSMVVVDIGDVGLFKQKMGTGFWQR